MTPFFYTFNKPYPDDVRMAGTRAYHRWVADMIAPSNGRLIAVGEPGPSIDMAETLTELRFIADRGFRGVFVPGYVHNPAMLPLFDAHYEPYWAACNDMNLVLHLHAGWGMKQGGFTTLMDEIDKARQKLDVAGGNMTGLEDVFMGVMAMVDEENPESIFSLDLGPRQAIWQLIFAGVFDRYPNLKLVVAECRADWVPALKRHLDERFASTDKRPNIKLKPSEYFGRNVFITPTSPRPSEVERRHEIGIRNFLFGADFPHPEGTWPNTLTWLRAVFQDLPEHELRAIMGENAIGVYGLDQSWLADIAANIGFAPTDIIGSHKVDERIIADFNYRSGFSKVTPTLDQGLIDTRVDVDLVATAA
jgi:predicted TIM-barrel fold metal-dependent hydrolase